VPAPTGEGYTGTDKFPHRISRFRVSTNVIVSIRQLDVAGQYRRSLALTATSPFSAIFGLTSPPIRERKSLGPAGQWNVTRESASRGEPALCGATCAESAFPEHPAFLSAHHSYGHSLKHAHSAVCDVAPRRRRLLDRHCQFLLRERFCHPPEAVAGFTDLNFNALCSPVSDKPHSVGF